jgi:hypothetical protein
MTAPFIIFALPRSRTKWLSAFLSYGPWVCCHDALLDLDCVAALRALLASPHTGLSETAMAFAAPLIRRHFPEARFVVVRRELEEVRGSLAEHGWHYPEGMLEAMAAQVDAVSAMPGTLTVAYDDLATEAACRAIFETCLDLPWDREWWQAFDATNIQIDMVERRAASDAAAPAIADFAAEVAAMMAPVVLAEERWEAFAPDGLGLIADHYAEVGSYEHEEFDLNIPLIESMSSAGLLQIVTARAAGLLVGYLVFTITPSLKARSELNAVQAPFYVRPAWRGFTGLKMHREAIRLLKAKGVKRLTLRSGVRGVGGRQDAIFRRLGATDDGHMFNLWIGE